jgi:hypothetical protein
MRWLPVLAAACCLAAAQQPPTNPTAGIPANPPAGTPVNPLLNRKNALFYKTLNGAGVGHLCLARHTSSRIIL